MKENRELKAFSVCSVTHKAYYLKASVLAKTRRAHKSKHFPQIWIKVLNFSSLALVSPHSDISIRAFKEVLLFIQEIPDLAHNERKERETSLRFENQNKVILNSFLVAFRAEQKPVYYYESMLNTTRKLWIGGEKRKIKSKLLKKEIR